MLAVVVAVAVVVREEQLLFFSVDTTRFNVADLGRAAVAFPIAAEDEDLLLLS
jgi:hypothetical protein